MKFIPPLEISAKIMTLIEEAEKEIILISPYVSLDSWTKMKNCLQRAVKRNVKIVFFARENAKQDLSFIQEIGIQLILLKDLHAKLYLNENYGIVTSQNITQYSDTNSIDIGYKTQTESERKELLSFVDKYIKTKKTVSDFHLANQVVQKDKTDELDFEELDYLYNSLSKHYPNSKLKKTATYVFSNNILKFGDILCDHKLTIKIKKNQTDFEKIVKNIEFITDKFERSFHVEKLTTHKSFFYLTFIPEADINFRTSVGLFLEIIDEILKK